MIPRSNQNVDDKEAAAIGVEVVPKLQTETSGRTVVIEDGSASDGEQQKVPPSRSRMTRREYILLAIGVLALIGLAVGLAVALTAGNNTNDSSTTPAEEDPFPETRAYIDNVCSSEDDLSLCQEVCAPAECCNDRTRDSCLATNANDCHVYAKCHVVLEDEPLAPPAPLDLNELCSLEDLTACSDACQAVQCCYNDSTEESCVATRFLTCLDYAPCQVLKTTDVSLKPADATSLLEACSLSVDGTTPSEECEVACRPASCCWEQEEGCFQSDFMACMTYSPCDTLHFRRPHAVVDPPTVDMEQVCGLDSLFTQEGYEECQEQCKEGFCCHASTEPYNCFNEDPFGCLDYQKCELLPVTGGSVPRAPSNIEEMCKAIDELDSGALQTCIDTCKPSACCVAEGDGNCYDDGNAFACDEYQQVCKRVHSLPLGDLKAPPTSLNLCTAENLQTDAGFITCSKICAPAACCNSLGSDNCLLENIVTCADWNLGGCYLLEMARAQRDGAAP